MGYLASIALIYFISASLLGLNRAWRAKNLDNLKYGKSEISFIRYFLSHLDILVLNIIPTKIRIDDAIYEKRRKHLNIITYTIYLLFIISIFFYILSFD